MSRIYVASSWRNKYYTEVVRQLREAGHAVYDFRNPSHGRGFTWKDVDADYAHWSVAQYLEGLNDEKSERQFKSDMDALLWADVCLLLLPCGRSAHTEAGWMAGQGKRTIVYIPEPGEPELMYKLFDLITGDMDEVLRYLDGACNPPSVVVHCKPFHKLALGELYELLRLRSEVFVLEQHCVYQDMDGDDRTALHLWLTVGDSIVALCRVCPAGTHMQQVSIGRVITTDRGKGYGRQLMLHAIETAQQSFGATEITIEAQEYAKGFYESVGFRTCSEPFILDGIPHITMVWRIQK